MICTGSSGNPLLQSEVGEEVGQPAAAEGCAL